MRKRISIMLILAMFMSVLLVGCSGGNTTADKKEDTAKATDKKPLKVVLLVNGSLGDKSFFDSANNGMKMIKEKYGAETKTIEMGTDRTKWEPTLADISEEDWDVVIVGTFDMVQPLTKIAAANPNKKYIIFDVPVDYSNGKNKNVYSVSYNYSEGAFLGGVIAAGMSKTNKVGIVGAMDIPVVNDFIVGIIQGAKYKNKDVKVATKYVGSFADPAKGKEIALAQYNSGIDIIANGAAISGFGVIEAAKDKKKLVIGTDSDQAMLFKETDIEKAKCIPVSIMKRVDLSLERAIGLYTKGELKFGTAEVLGVKDGCIDITRNEFYTQLVPDALKAEVEAVFKKIASGEIKVESVVGGMTKERLDEIRNNAN